MSVVQGIHVEAPVEKVFDFWKDPRKQWTLAPDKRITLTEVNVTDEGVGMYYNWRAHIAGITVEGFDVFTEFVLNQRITDKSSRAFDGTWTFTFEPLAKMKAILEAAPESAATG